jgi:FMN reductase
VLRDLPAAALVRADFDDPAIRRAREQVAAARLVVIATPIYKAAYSGLLKIFLDLLPQDALRGKTVLALGTGGSAAHLLALDYALKPVLAALGARHILDAVYAVDAQFTPHPQHGHVAHDDVLQRIERALADGPLPLRVASPLALVA